MKKKYEFSFQRHAKETF